MELVARQADDRRDGSPVEYPLTDSRGLLVDKDRRRYSDRRRIGGPPSIKQRGASGID
jgi:hypothetical protein